MLRKVLRKICAVLVSLLALVLAVIVVAANVLTSTYSAMISMALGQPTFKIEGGADPQYYESAFATEQEMNDRAAEVCREIEREGMVLLKNEGGALPLAAGAKVSLLSQNAVDLVYGGTGAGSVDTSSAPDLKTALEAAGLVVNPTLWEFYTTGAGKDYRKEVPSITGAGVFRAHEVPQALYTDEVKGSFTAYGDAAIVVIGRSGGESADLTAGLNEGGHYLELNADEKDLLQLACDSFDKVIVLINTTNPMEMGFLNEYPVDACLWVGAVGQEGAWAIGEALAGAVNPSGRLVDTWAYDAFSAPAMANFGDYTIVNSQVASGDKYMVYAEGIYVGYRYYETRYEDVVLGKENAANYDYARQVQFPFGYGLSYTKFAWSDYAVTEKADVFEVSLTVKNTGAAAGKEVVQIYLQSPYTDYDRQNRIEKASVELVGFAKTGVLAPGEAETVTVSVNKELLKTYDAEGYGTYILDAGDYYLTAAKNAHEALNNILTAKGKTQEDGMTGPGDAAFAWTYHQPALDSATYAVSGATGEPVSNQFETTDIRYYDPDFTYLSRSDWQGTWPETYAQGRLTAGAELLADLETGHSEDPAAVMPKFETVSDEYGRLTLLDLMGAEFSDPRWEALLDQMSKQELYDLVRRGGYGTMTVESINAPATVDKDGPAGISATLAGGNISCMAYPPEVVMASTWNTELVEEMGRMVGEDSISTGISIWYAPAMNIHRTAFSGRNFEYYSEDGFLSGKLGAAECRGFQEKGGIVTIKHFALNDQETNRTGGAMFANEQSVREIYLKGFELSVREGKANGVMTSMNRLGARWSGGHEGLMNDTLRGEWGFEGFAVTDQTSFPSFNYCDILEGLEAGNDLWLNTSSSMWKQKDEALTPTVMNNVRTAAHRVLYTIANSNAMNGMDKDSHIVTLMPGWQKALIGVSVVLGALVALLVYCAVRLFRKKKVKAPGNVGAAR
ncbi:glycoside hydrolase family 3 C-terminal domain-containing protein [Allofournierella sp.]|uniref:glycoside hydrolase family 3 protein n=1 Tax=Allofournierella sp. TaxID=1940256 RepID=UPI003AB78970